jgi:tryptophan 2,3-dioxygenase
VSLTYGSYLKVEELLSLQQLRSEDEHDETLFIIIHQSYELWFKQILHEMDLLQRSLEDNDTPTAMATFKRILTILKTLVAQVDILETMTPVSFLTFRSRIDNASGFQSLQFRQLEIALGHRRPGMVSHQPEGSAGRRLLEEGLGKRSLWDSFLRFLVHHGYTVPEEILERDLSRPTEENDVVQQELIRLYREDPYLREVCERLVDLDEGLQEWRYRHVKMVERTIGTKKGTGGSSGAEYLRSTLFQPLFPDLWAIRTHL